MKTANAYLLKVPSVAVAVLAAFFLSSCSTTEEVEKSTQEPSHKEKNIESLFNKDYDAPIASSQQKTIDDENIKAESTHAVIKPINVAALEKGSKGRIDVERE
ncbi:MAG: hypothetical protein PHQ27_08910, partial [Victivallales bacterium]|nr:hypothetical protein [Victivallales bacterium]